MRVQAVCWKLRLLVAVGALPPHRGGSSGRSVSEIILSLLVLV